MLNVRFVRIAEAALPRLRAWLDQLPARRAELAESYRRQHTRHELFHLLQGRDGPVLAIVSESGDLEAGTSEFLQSELAIDVEFKSLIQDIAESSPAAELLYDSREVIPLPGRGRSGSGDSGAT